MITWAGEAVDYRAGVEATQVTECERIFRRHGLPLLIHDHSAKRDVFGRTAPLLLLILLTELLAAMKFGWPVWLNLLVLLGAASLLIGGFIGLNVVCGRPWSTLPQDVGIPELAFFVIAPAVPAALAGGQWGTALSVVLINLGILAAIYGVVRYGLHSTLAWGVAGAFSDLGESLLRLIRLLPLLLVFSMVLFYNTEVWQVFDNAPEVSDYILWWFFVGLIITILALRLRSETNTILSRAVAATPGATDLPDLTRAQRRNVRVMVGSNQLLQVMVVSLGVGIFFLVLGFLTITPKVMTAWGVSGGAFVDQIPLTSTDNAVISATLLRVATALATFTGLYYAISVLTDGVYRDDFIDGMADRMAMVYAARVSYESALEQTEPD